LSRERGLRGESQPGDGAQRLIAPSAKRHAAWIEILEMLPVEWLL
jgi:hypothetical protein